MTDPSTSERSPEPEHQVHIGHVDVVLAVLKWAGGSGGGGRGDGIAIDASLPPSPPHLAATPLYLERGPGGKTVLATEDG
jgi:hypothetical protein